ncbi:MAG: hypothetical protein NTW60_00030 [Candidatus Wolfebacteria bacterium]|nr:hypothetical protein [Candidatus Wolfebacteria bacterium]
MIEIMEIAWRFVDLLIDFLIFLDSLEEYQFLIVAILAFFVWTAEFVYAARKKGFGNFSWDLFSMKKVKMVLNLKPS